MSLEAEALADRKRLQRHLTFWRIGVLVLAVLILLGFLASNETLTNAFGSNDQIARVTIKGLITDDRPQQELLKEIKKASHVKALILYINSPGGTTAGGEALYEEIRRVTKNKPVVAVFGTIATSAAYMAGIATDHIVSRGNTITGSVGVILQWAEISELLKNLGVQVEEIKSGTLKAAPSPFRPADEESRALTQDMVAESHKWFVELVTERRKISAIDIPGLKDGRIYSGRRALKLKLVDAIGGEETAVKWLEEKRKIAKNLKIVDWKPKQTYPFSFVENIARAIAGITGLPVEKLVNFTNADVNFGRLRLDGLYSVWHPEVN